MEEQTIKGGMSTGMVVGIAVLVAIVFGGGAYAYVNNKAEKEKKDLNAQIAELQDQVSSLQTTTTTASWKTFSNSRYGYSIKYPEKWYVQTDNSEEDFTKRGGADVGIDYIGGDTYWSNYSNFDYTLGDEPTDRQVISLMIYKTDQSLNDFFNIRYNNSGTEISGKSTTTIQGKESMKFTITSKASVVLVKLSNGIMLFNTDESKTFDSMISSLKFTK